MVQVKTKHDGVVVEIYTDSVKLVAGDYEIAECIPSMPVFK